jgi:nitrate/TMAO reductase-like tetraheme cytochrome c subunit
MNSPPPDAPRPVQHYRNWLSLAGAVVATGSLFSFLFLFAIDLFAHNGNPYMGILAYVVAPCFFVLGTLMWVLGVWIQRRRARVDLLSRAITIDLSRPRDKRVLVAFIAGTVVFLLASAMGSYNTYHYTESVNFCGEACHTPMKPEFTAYLNSAHARVACTECHVGSGAKFYVKSKINGVHQLYGVVTDSYHRPIKTPIKNLRPAEETCEQCHWPKKFIGSLDRTFVHFLADETNTPFAVRLSLKVGGADPSSGPLEGIHWHMNVGNKIEYVASDDQRQIIPWVRVTSSSGKVTEYHVKGFQDRPAPANIRLMDCMDCHNRPAHNFQPPNDSVDLAMHLGQIDPSLPWVKSNAVAALTQTYSTESEAMDKINSSLRGAYNKSAHVDDLVHAVQQIYRENFFPEMKADWRVYPDNIGHKNWPGCFRCHDGLHKTEDGKAKIPASDCNACHIIIAQGSGAQLEQLSAKGVDFFHIDANYSDFTCNNCHTGAFTK